MRQWPDPHEVEIELGYFNLERTKDENTFRIPSLVLNYGLVENWEVVGEFKLEEGSQDLNIVDPGVFLKAVIREGWLQGKDRLGIAVEAGPLLPSTVKGNGVSASKESGSSPDDSRGSRTT